MRMLLIAIIFHDNNSREYNDAFPQVFEKKKNKNKNKKQKQKWKQNKKNKNKNKTKSVWVAMVKEIAAVLVACSASMKCWVNPFSGPPKILQQMIISK